MAGVCVDLRVVRGPDWDHGDEDGGEGYLGTVVEVHCVSAPSAAEQTTEFVTESEQPQEKELRSVTVQWDCGHRGRYHCGEGGKYDLRVFDNAQTGKHAF